VIRHSTVFFVLAAIALTSVTLVASATGMAAGQPQTVTDSQPLRPVGLAAAPTVITATGVLTTDIIGAVNTFRALLGANNGVGGSFTTGRREINWDAVPDGFAAPNDLPADFFNANSPRGAVFAPASVAFQVSADASNPTSTTTRFGHINPSYPANFHTFSPERLFTAVDDELHDVLFLVPRTKFPAAVRGFGVVFTDVEHNGSASIELFNGAISLGAFAAPANVTSGALSFVGVDFGGHVVTGVTVKSGEAPLGQYTNDLTDGGYFDLVVMDDFIYGEPISSRVYLPIAVSDR